LRFCSFAIAPSGSPACIGCCTAHFPITDLGMPTENWAFLLAVARIALLTSQLEIKKAGDAGPPVLSIQLGRLLLLRLRRIGLPITLSLLRGGLCFIRSGGLGGFIGAARLLIGHSISFKNCFD
jgi:hypothetical protein